MRKAGPRISKFYQINEIFLGRVRREDSKVKEGTGGEAFNRIDMIDRKEKTGEGNGVAGTNAFPDGVETGKNARNITN